jgi:hypothetical protein
LRPMTARGLPAAGAGAHDHQRVGRHLGPGGEGGSLMPSREVAAGPYPDIPPPGS